MNEQDKKFYATSAFLMIDDLKKENKNLKLIKEKIEKELEEAKEADFNVHNYLTFIDHIEKIIGGNNE